MCTYVLSIAQSKNDYNWIITKNYEPATPEAEGYHWRFTEDGLVRDYVETPDGIFRQINTMSDSEGNLLFYSNGCAVYNADHELMENGDGINDVSSEFNQFCPGGYPGAHNMVVTLDPKNSKGYYIIHKPVEDGHTNRILYTYIDMTMSNGLGGVMEKNISVYDEETTKWGHVNVCKHANGRDWWFTQIIDSTNIFLVFLIDEDGVQLSDSVLTGPTFIEQTGFNQALYNRDGSKFVIHGSEHHVLVYDFDRNTGKLEFDQQIFLTEPGFQQFSRGAMFSPNNRFLYVNTQRELYQIDMWESDLYDGLQLIAEWDGFLEETVGVPVVFGNMVHGPDCKIYMTTAAGIQYMHMIEYPDEQGQACGFKQHSIKLDIPAPPFYSNTIPFYRMDEDAPCDPTLVGLQDLYGVDAVPFTIYPNPTSDYVHLQLNEKAEVTRYELLSMDGRLIEMNEVDGLEHTIDLTTLPSGMYFIKVYDIDGASQVEKIVKK